MEEWKPCLAGVEHLQEESEAQPGSPSAAGTLPGDGRKSLGLLRLTEDDGSWEGRILEPSGSGGERDGLHLENWWRLLREVV